MAKAAMASVKILSSFLQSRLGMTLT